MEDFNIKKFLIENKLTTNSKLVKEESDAPVDEIHSTSNVTDHDGKPAFDEAMMDILQIADQLKPGASFSKSLKQAIKEVLIEYGERMMDLGESLSRGEDAVLSKVAAEE